MYGTPLSAWAPPALPKDRLLSRIEQLLNWTRNCIRNRAATVSFNYFSKFFAVLLATLPMSRLWLTCRTLRLVAVIVGYSPFSRAWDFLAPRWNPVVVSVLALHLLWVIHSSWKTPLSQTHSHSYTLALCLAQTHTQGTLVMLIGPRRCPSHGSVTTTQPPSHDSPSN